MAKGIQRTCSIQFISLALLLIVQEISGACVEFDEVPEADYDRTYSKINNANARPLGFQRATLPFDGEDICYSATGVGDGRGVEVAYEAVPSSILCVRSRDGTELGCDSKNQHCSMAVANPTEFHFYLDVSQGSTESDVNFWVRVTKGLPAANDTEDMWCSERSVSYPESLGALPGFVTPPQTTVISGSVQLTTSLFIVMMMVFIGSALLNKV